MTNLSVAQIGYGVEFPVNITSLNPHPITITPIFRPLVTFLAFSAGLGLGCKAIFSDDFPWTRHTIDNSSRGADGVKMGHLNNDGLIDLTVGWEEGGLTRVYLHPGAEAVTEIWPSTKIGVTRSTEDATFVDLNRDDILDVVSSCEGNEQALYLHFAPNESDILTGEKWTQRPLPGSVGMTRWMFVTPTEINFGDQSERLLTAGSKDPNGVIGFWKIPKYPEDPSSDWDWHPLSKAGWIMSIIPKDMDGDQDIDIFFIDRKGDTRGAYWMENPGSIDRQWDKHLIGGSNEELLFSDLKDLNSDGLEDLVATAKDNRLLWWRRLDRSGKSWELEEVEYPKFSARAKAVAIGDVDGDGLLDLVANCENANPPLQGVFWLRQSKNKPLKKWEAFGISGPEGVKFDRIELVDLDLDGDLDILTCEEHHVVGGERTGLGVIWYENPF